jgi:hypothetical protein
VARIAEDQVQRGAGRLLLAVRVVDEQLVEVRDRVLDPPGSVAESSSNSGSAIARV